MLCMKRLAMRAPAGAGYLDAVCREAGNESPELATLMLCVERLAMMAPELATLMLCVKRLRALSWIF